MRQGKGLVDRRGTEINVPRNRLLVKTRLPGIQGEMIIGGKRASERGGRRDGREEVEWHLAGVDGLKRRRGATRQGNRRDHVKDRKM